MSQRSSAELPRLMAAWRRRELAASHVLNLAEAFQHLQTIVLPQTHALFIYGETLLGDLSTEPVAAGWDWTFLVADGRINVDFHSVYSTARLVDEHGVLLGDHQATVVWLQVIEGLDWMAVVRSLIAEDLGHDESGRSALH